MRLCFCQAQPKLQVKLSLKAELALFSFDPATPEIAENSHDISYRENQPLSYRLEH
jgi:hypothetical protein